jgi:hypothetical protein
VFQIAPQGNGDDFHIVVGMGTKTHTALNGIVIKHTECAKLYALGIKPASKTKTVFGLKPAVVGTASGI